MADTDEDSWTCATCTFQNPDSQLSCSMCYTERSPISGFLRFHGGTPLSICRVSSFLSNMVSGALTGTFALFGAVSGAITGAIASRAASSGILRGAGLGAVAGAVLSVEVLEASRMYWNSQRVAGSSVPSMSDFLEDLLSGRFIQEFVAPAISATQQWQMNFAEMSYEELYEMFVPSEGRIKGASEELLKSLPQHVVTQCNKVNHCGDAICCAICLQELEQGDIARALPRCNHTFHLSCVDRWLVMHMICPVCRQHLH